MMEKLGCVAILGARHCLGYVNEKAFAEESEIEKIKAIEKNKKDLNY